LRQQKGEIKHYYCINYDELALLSVKMEKVEALFGTNQGQAHCPKLHY